MTHLRAFFKSWLDSLSRYPGANLVAVLLAISAIMLSHQTDPMYATSDLKVALTQLRTVLARIVASGLFMLPLMIIGPLLRQIKPSLPKRYEIVGQGTALMFGLLFYISLPQDFQNTFEGNSLWIILSMILAWVLPLRAIVRASGSDPELIRGRSKQLIVALVIAMLSSLIVGGGIAASLSSIEHLFLINIDSTIYLDVWIAVWSLLGTSIWLINLRDNPQDREYIPLLRFFGLYIFLPLAILYALILLVYSLQIISTGDRPRGMVTRMVIGYTIFGLIGYLLVYPLRADHSWLRKIHIGYFISLLLFVILLFVAIGIRIDQYGLTSQRYLVVMSGLWICIISGISLRRSRLSLPTIIIAFVLCLLVSAVGPQSASNLPITLQYNQLISLLQTNNFLKDGKIIPRKVRIATGESLSGDILTIYSIAKYLGEQEDTTIFKPLYAGSGFNQLSGVNKWIVGEQFMVSLGVDNVFANAVDFPNGESHDFSFYSNGYTYATDISDYSLFIPIRNYAATDGFSGLNIVYERDDKSKIIIAAKSKTYTIDLLDHIEEIKKACLQVRNSGPEPTALKIQYEDYILFFSDISLQELANGNVTIGSYNGFLLLK